METKKSTNVNLEKYKGVFYLIGIMISLGIILTFFSWKSNGGKKDDLSAIYKTVDDEMAEITRSEEIKMPEPEVKKTELKSEIIEEVTDETDTEDIDIDTDIDEGDDVKIIELPEPVEKEDSSIYVNVQKMPEYPGGIQALRRDLAKNIKYPPLAKESDIQGTVYVRFVVEKNGSVGTIQLLRGVDELLDNESIRVIKLLKRFKPGMHNGKSVKVWFSVPVKYTLN